MIPGGVVGPSVLNGVFPCSFGASGTPMVYQVQLTKRISCPTKHIGLEFINAIPAGRAHESPDRLPAGAPVNFCRPTHMKAWIPAGLFHQRAIHDRADCSPTDSQLRMRSELLEGPFEIVRIKREVAIQLYHVFP